MCERDSSSSLSVCEDAKRYLGCSSKISSSDIAAVLGMSSKFQILTDSILVVCWLIVEPKDVIHFAVTHFLKNTHDLILTIIQVLWLLLLVASSGCIHKVHLGAQLNLINKFMLRLPISIWTLGKDFLLCFFPVHLRVWKTWMWQSPVCIEAVHGGCFWPLAVIWSPKFKTGSRTAKLEATFWITDNKVTQKGRGGFYVFQYSPKVWPLSPPSLHLPHWFVCLPPSHLNH